MVPRKLLEHRGIVAALIQCRNQLFTLVEPIAAEAHHQIARLQIVAADQPQGLRRSRAEFRLHSQAWGDVSEQGNGSIRFEVVETEGDQPTAAAAAIGSQQVQLATQAVAEAQRWWQPAAALLEVATGCSQIAPGLACLALMVEARDVRPGMNRDVSGYQTFQKTPIAQLRRGRQIAAADELHQRPRTGGPELPDRSQLTPAVTHARDPARSFRMRRASRTWAGPSSRLSNRCRMSPSPSIT